MGCGAVGINQPGPENGSVDTASAQSSSTDDASRAGNFHRSRSLTSVFTVAEDVDNLSLPLDATLESFQALIAGTNIGAVFNIEHFKGDGAFASVYGGTGAGGELGNGDGCWEMGGECLAERGGVLLEEIAEPGPRSRACPGRSERGGPKRRGEEDRECVVGVLEA